MTTPHEIGRIRCSIDGLIESLRDDRKELVADILSRVVCDQMNMFKAKAAVGLQDSVSDLMESFKLALGEEVIGSCMDWKASQPEWELLPPNCRFEVGRGQTRAVVIEQAPGLRTLTLDEALLDNLEQPNLPYNTTRQFCLAFPYVVFVVVFYEGEVTSLYTGWRREPLRSLNDRLCVPTLPNLHRNLSVCTGDEDRHSRSISEACNQAISRFWSSRFNTDLSQYWWTKGTIFPQLGTVEGWAEASIKDPLFILQGDFTPTKTVLEVVQSVLQDEEAPDADAMRRRLYERIDGVSQAIFDGLLRYFRRIKPERYYPKDITGPLSDAIGAVADDVMYMAGRLDESVAKLAQAADRVRKDTTHHGWERRGVFWTESKD